MSFQQKNKIKSFDSSSINSYKNSIKTYWLNSSDSINSNNQTQKIEFDSCMKLMLSETEFNVTNFEIMLNFYIRKNPKIKNEIIEKITNTLNNAKINIYYRAIIKCINTILDLLIENFQIINLVNNIIPLVLNILFQEENIKNKQAIHELCEFIGKLIKIGNINISGLIDEIIDTIFLDILKENPNEHNIYYAYIHLLSEIMKNSPFVSFNSIIMKNGIENFTKLQEICFKSKNDMIREMFGELTNNFIKMLINRDNETKKGYMSLLYFNIFKHYEYNVKLNNNFPNNYYLVANFFIFLKKINLSYPQFFKDDSLYRYLVDYLMKCKNCGKNEINIKIEFFNFIPEIYLMNTTIFKQEYLKDFLEYSNEVLIKENNMEIKNNLLSVLGTLNFYEYDLINEICRQSIISLLQKLL